MQETDFGLIGPALSSFIRFANIYYDNLYNRLAHPVSSSFHVGEGIQHWGAAA
jgi:hypothetical protein